MVCGGGTRSRLCFVPGGRMIGENYIVELTAESLLQCSVTALTTPPPPLPTGGPFAALDTPSSNVTLSSGNLTATHNDTAVGGARCTAFKTSGKYFFSVTVGASNGA